MKSRMIVVVSLLGMLMMACSLTGNAAGNPADKGLQGHDPVPVSLNDGLASLDSYRMTVVFNFIGPDPTQSSKTTIIRQRSTEPNASLTSINTAVVGKGGGDPSISDSSIYQIGNDQCTGSQKGDWSWISSTPAEAEMEGLVTSMIGLTPLIDHPSFVAAETVNGIPANHFTFKVSGLGASSGAVVNINQGDYWLAVDGQFIVKYALIVETSMSAQTEVLHEEISIELNQINQPVSIAFPQGCLDAAPVTPMP